MVKLPDLKDYETDKNDLQFTIPENFNFGFDVIEKRAEASDKTAFIYINRSREIVEHHSFKDLNLAANRFANVLLKMGVKKGEMALLITPRIPPWYQILIACIKVGVVAMPGTNLLTAKDIQYRINKSRAKLAIVTEEHAHKIEEIQKECPSLQHLILVGNQRRGWLHYETACRESSDILQREDVEPTSSEDMMLVYFTSGTTSLPKMVPRNQSYALAHLLTGHYWMDLKESDIHWTLSDTGWAKAAWGMLFGQWLIGASVVFYDGDPKFDADAHLSLIGKLGVTTFCAPPTIFRLFGQIDLSPYDLSSVRHTVSAGEPLNPEAMRNWEKATGTVPHDGYGQTETVNLVANFPGLAIRPGSMGKPVPGLEVEIIDDEGKRCPDGEIGHIAVKVTDPYPPGLFRGYFEDPEANSKVFRNGWYYTGDTATRDADGYIWFVGRADDIISSASYRISPFEVESALQEHPAVAESAVVGKKDPLRGEIVKAFVTLAAGFEASEELIKDIQDFVKNQTAPYKYPREIEFRQELPKTISGKIRRVELRGEG
ncbi:MAG: AMP-binding protein [SAR324 cluster bacterium]|nr:AMP-binding protein [SAR324 cluster bacterium]